MLREKLLMHHDPVDGFRWRSHEVTRVEGFSDAVFGFAVTLLIVSLEVPRTSTELLATMRGFGSFVITFFMLAALWYRQHVFFRRYGLEDSVTVILNLVLLFMVLFFVYPLKFLFGVMLSDPFLRKAVATTHGLEQIVLPEHRPIIWAIFGGGFTAVMIVFALLYRHAYRKRDELGLNEFEVFETQHSVRRLWAAAGVGLSYFAIAYIDTLPARTPAEKNIVKMASLAVLAAIALLLARMAMLARDRKRVKGEWKARQAETQAHPPEEHSFPE